MPRANVHTIAQYAPALDSEDDVQHLMLAPINALSRWVSDLARVTGHEDISADRCRAIARKWRAVAEIDRAALAAHATQRASLEMGLRQTEDSLLETLPTWARPTLGGVA